MIFWRLDSTLALYNSARRSQLKSRLHIDLNPTIILYDLLYFLFPNHDLKSKVQNPLFHIVSDNILASIERNFSTGIKVRKEPEIVIYFKRNLTRMVAWSITILCFFGFYDFSNSYYMIYLIWTSSPHLQPWFYGLWD